MYDIIMKIVTKLKALPELIGAVVGRIGTAEGSITDLGTAVTGLSGDVTNLQTATKNIGMKLIYSNYNAEAQDVTVPLEEFNTYLVIISSFGGKTPAAYLVVPYDSSSVSGGQYIAMASGNVTNTVALTTGSVGVEVTCETYCRISVYKLKAEVEA